MRLLLISLLMVFTTACSTLIDKPPSAPADELWQQRLPALINMTDWAFRGRTVITQDREGWNAGVTWKQHAESYQIRLSGPFSQGGAVLEGTPQQVRLTLSDGQAYQAQTPEQLLADVMDVQLPVSALRDWVRGLPHQQLEVNAMTLDEQGRLTALEQQGWQVSFLRYVPFEGKQLPDKVFIKKEGLSVRIVMSGWSRAQ